MNIYLVLGGNSSGPYDRRQVDDMYRTGKVTNQTLCWWNGLNSWVPLSRLLAGNLNVSSGAGLPVSGDLYDSMVRSPLIDGALPGTSAKIVMGIESLRREEFLIARDFFMAALADSPSVAAGWLGVACFEAAMAPSDQQALKRLTHAMGKAAQCCTLEFLLLECYLQILTFLIIRGVAAHSKALETRGALLNSAMRSANASKQAASASTRSIFWGALGGVLASKSKGTFSKVIGYGAAGTMAVKAIDSSREAVSLREEATAKVSSAEQAYLILVEAAMAVAYALKEGRRISGRCSPQSRAKFAQVAQDGWPVAGAMYKDQLGKIKERLLPLLRGPSKWDPRKKTHGYPEDLNNAIALGNSFGVSSLAVQQNLGTLLPDIRKIVSDSGLLQAESKEISARNQSGRRRTYTLIGIAALIGIIVFFGGNSFGINPLPWTMAIGCMTLILWLVLRSATSPLPVERAIRTRLDNLDRSLVGVQSLDGEIKQLLV